MKKLLSVMLSIILMGSCLIPAAAADEMQYPNKREDILIRDPCILVHDGKYYMFGTGVAWNGYGCYVSEDLENWSNAVRVCSLGGDAIGDFWAPECVEYQGKFYLFATYKSGATGHRGTAVFRADSPLGPFEQISDGHATPKDWDSIDGTLYVAPDGQPWMVFVHEWTSTDDGIGRMCVAKMNEDLSALISEPIEIFRADEGKCGMDRNVTDGPYVYTCRDGKLIMLWSNNCDDGYSVGMAEAESIDGTWRQQPRLLFTKSNSLTDYDGGHGMIFETLDGKMMLSVHSPNGSGDGYHETAVFHEVVEANGTLYLKTEYEKLQKIRSTVSEIFARLSEIFSKAWGAVVNVFAKIFNSSN